MDHVHRLDSRKENAHTPEGLELHRGAHDSFDRPTALRGVLDEHLTLLHLLLDVARSQRVGRRLAHNTGENHLQRVLHPLDHLAQRLDHRLHPFVRLASPYQRRLIATEPFAEHLLELYDALWNRLQQVNDQGVAESHLPGMGAS